MSSSMDLVWITYTLLTFYAVKKGKSSFEANVLVEHTLSVQEVRITCTLRG